MAAILVPDRKLMYVGYCWSSPKCTAELHPATYYNSKMFRDHKPGSLSIWQRTIICKRAKMAKESMANLWTLVEKLCI